MLIVGVRLLVLTYVILLLLTTMVMLRCKFSGLGTLGLPAINLLTPLSSRSVATLPSVYGNMYVSALSDSDCSSAFCTDALDDVYFGTAGEDMQ